MNSKRPVMGKLGDVAFDVNVMLNLSINGKAYVRGRL